MKFLCNRSAADLIVALKNKRLESGAREIEGRDKAIVATANDYDVAGIRHSLCSVSFLCVFPLCTPVPSVVEDLGFCQPKIKSLDYSGRRVTQSDQPASFSTSNAASRP